MGEISNLGQQSLHKEIYIFIYMYKYVLASAADFLTTVLFRNAAEIHELKMSLRMIVEAR